MDENYTQNVPVARSPWTPWMGGTCPVSPEAFVMVVYRLIVNDTPLSSVGRAGEFDWGRADDPRDMDISAFRIVSEPEGILETTPDLDPL